MPFPQQQRERWIIGLSCLFLAFGLFRPSPIQAQDSVQVLEEGRVLHQPTRRLYYYRIDADSTVLVRQERPSTDTAGIVLPANTYSQINRQVEKQILTPDWYSENLVFHYEDQYLVLQFTQRFDLYVLGTLIVVVLVGGSLLAWLWWKLSKERRRRAAIARSRRYLAQGREKERERLAQEIHDGPVQDLHGLHMQLNAAARTNGDQLETIGDELMRVTGELRAMSADLHPPALQQFGLPAALRSHADRLRDRTSDLQVDLDLPDEAPSLPEPVALSLFRVAQEAMNNAVQHGNANHIRVRLQCVDDTVELDVEDDGVGFTPPDDWHTLADQDHYGLLGMQERAEAIGADLDISAAPGEGTHICLRGPVTGDTPASVSA
ncbi:sensor histidine kinase [Salinibacter sp. 10B]|uniref:sensor histidine kinase n=1 Tax=Salinibacter sp. 10B TaxID=1923971 RepID=UPI0011AFD4EB|nr:sensor histidine kinase [Salinibacter sp. 10B]